MTFAVLDVILKSSNRVTEKDEWMEPYKVAALTRSLSTKPNQKNIQMLKNTQSTLCSVLCILTTGISSALHYNSIFRSSWISIKGAKGLPSSNWKKGCSWQTNPYLFRQCHLKDNAQSALDAWRAVYSQGTWFQTCVAAALITPGRSIKEWYVALNLIMKLSLWALPPQT